jgi:hypothetical protein
MCPCLCQLSSRRPSDVGADIKINPAPASTADRRADAGLDDAVEPGPVIPQAQLVSSLTDWATVTAHVFFAY